MIFGLLKDVMIKYFFKFVIFCMIIFNFSCENNLANIQALNNTDLSVETGKNIVINFSFAGKPKSILKAPLMIRSLDESNIKTTFPQTVYIDFYKDSINIESKLFAKYGYFLENDNTVYFKDSVVCYNNLGDTLWSDEITWDAKKEKFHSEKKVKLKQHSPLSKIDAIGFESDRNLANITFFKIQKNSFFTINDSLTLK